MLKSMQKPHSLEIGRKKSVKRMDAVLFFISFTLSRLSLSFSSAVAVVAHFFHKILTMPFLVVADFPPRDSHPHVPCPCTLFMFLKSIFSCFLHQLQGKALAANVGAEMTVMTMGTNPHPSNFAVRHRPIINTRAKIRGIRQEPASEATIIMVGEKAKA
jgi:hypothetical protein